MLEESSLAVPCVLIHQSWCVICDGELVVQTLPAATLSSPRSLQSHWSQLHIKIEILIIQHIIDSYQQNWGINMEALCVKNHRDIGVKD